MTDRPRSRSELGALLVDRLGEDVAHWLGVEYVRSSETVRTYGGRRTHDALRAAARASTCRNVARVAVGHARGPVAGALVELGELVEALKALGEEPRS